MVMIYFIIYNNLKYIQSIKHNVHFRFKLKILREDETLSSLYTDLVIHRLIIKLDILQELAVSRVTTWKMVLLETITSVVAELVEQFVNL